MDVEGARWERNSGSCTEGERLLTAATTRCLPLGSQGPESAALGT